MRDRIASIPIASGFAARGMMACALALALAACSRGEDYSKYGRQAVPVVVAVAVEKPVAKTLHEIGTVDPYSTVSIKAQVGGVLTEIHFKEGQEVTRGQLLFTIDPRPYKADLDRAQANLASDRAKLKEASDEEARWRYMLKEGIGSQERYDQAHADADALRAAVEADQAALRTAQLNLAYCTITSPIDGKTGALMAHRGDLIKANADTPLLVINQIKPIYVDFSVPEKQLAEIRHRMPAGNLEVIAKIPGQQAPERGVLSFIDNQVNTTTGTIALKGMFDNRDERLWPGQFVDVALKLGEPRKAVLVPSQAIETGQEGQYVFVVGPNLKVETRKVIPGDEVDGATVIEQGLRAGERVVTDGQLRLVPGATVKIKPPVGGNGAVPS